MRKEFPKAEFLNTKSFGKNIRLAIRDKGSDYVAKLLSQAQAELKQVKIVEAENAKKEKAEQAAIKKLLAQAEKNGLSADAIAKALGAKKPTGGGRPKGSPNKPKVEATAE